MTEQLVALALIGPWLACVTGWALVLAGHTALAPFYALTDPRRHP